MKVACVLTTIQVPEVLPLYAKTPASPRFFVIGDRKTPDKAIDEFLSERVPRSDYYSIERQHDLGYACSQLIGENCIQRRNIGFLEALNWGADFIVTIDDDNIPIGEYFNQFWATRSAWNGIEATSESGWFDVGRLISGTPAHRGFPITQRATPAFRPAVDAKIGVAAGVCLGDPDISAVTRIERAPIAHNVSELLSNGVITDPRRCLTVFNSQNTSFIRQLTPAMFMLPFVGRYDDILASLICQRVMQEWGLCVHFGKPFVWQQRNNHNLVHDLRFEMMGMEVIDEFAEFLFQPYRAEHSIMIQLRGIWGRLATANILPMSTVQAAIAYLDDCEQVMQ
ncbi:MAG TPA: hypothetical protein VMH83_03975 [Candidatus Acidoferrum sp.]|nr:hypothetical protein [Candidatus Acidoferrum sp.]